MTSESAVQFAAQFNGAMARVLWHHSPEEFIEFLCRKDLYEFGSYCYPRDGHWNGVSYPKAIDKIRFGDDTRAEMAQKLFDQIALSDQITIGRNEIRPAIVGYVPNVPAVLAGQPETMLTRVRTDSYASNAPIRIFFDIGVSSGVRLPTLIKRGVAALALTMVTKQYRPIELYCVYSYLPTFFTCVARETAAINVIRIETNPLDLGRAAWMMTDNTMTRTIGIPLSSYIFQDKVGHLHSANNGYTRWGFGSDPTNDEYTNKITQAISLEPQDIFIKGGYLFDKLMLSDPVAWVNQMIENNRQLIEGV